MSDFNEQTERAAYEKEFGVIKVNANSPYVVHYEDKRWQGWLARAHLSHEENARLRAFAREIIREHQLETEGIQDLAVKHGLLAPVEATERCGEDCACAEYGDFPQTCYRMTSALAPKESRDEPQP